MNLMAGIYVHIPFCKRRCTYCDFFSTTRLEQDGGDYVDSLLAEAALRRGELNGELVETLYLGGGTPSLLPLRLLSRLVTGLAETFDLTGVAEFTIEANPDDVTPKWCRALPALGVNRVSMGVQSFEDDVLHTIGRRHNACQAVEAVSNLRHAGIDNISIDLIYGLPGQTLESWIDTVRQALQLHPQHFSAYSLSYEEGTPLWRQRERGEVTEVAEDVCLEMYHTMVEMLQAASYEHYEISNFALSGYYSRHNSSYWDGTAYLGLGAGAHSYDGEIRRANPCDLTAYMNKIKSGTTACELEPLHWWERYDERVMLGLRTARGVDAHRIREDFGELAWRHFVNEVQRHIDAGNVRQDDQGRYVLTPAGVMVSNMVMGDLLWDDDV